MWRRRSLQIRGQIAAAECGVCLDENGRLTVRGLNQIAVAEGEAAVAVTTIHNRLPRNACGVG